MHLPVAMAGTTSADHAGVEAWSSLHGHRLHLVSSTSVWFCDQCQETLTASDERFRCGTCPDFDACASCQGRPHQHPLKLVTLVDGRWFCDECRTVNNGRRFRCYSCEDYDMCGDCVTSSALPSMALVPAATCPGGHQLQLARIGRDSSGFPWHTCDTCQCRVEEGAVARCAACDYDLCPTCAVTAVAVASAPAADDRAAGQAAEEEDDDEEGGEAPEGSECVVCLRRASTHACVPCGHKCCCARCAGRVTGRCPVCRAQLQLMMRVFG